jgi:hypothetical protein
VTTTRRGDDRGTGDTTIAGVYGLPANTWNHTSTDVAVKVYADPTTFTGADPDPALDADDEIAPPAAGVRPGRRSPRRG